MFINIVRLKIFGIQNAILYIEYSDVTTVAFFLHKCYKNLLLFFVTNFLKCTLLHINILSHDPKGRLGSALEVNDF